MNTPILFSVVVPVYNGSLYLEDAINSVLIQTYKDWELIIVDDGSADNSLQVAADFAKKDIRIRIFQHQQGENRGVSASRNLAIQKSAGSWIALLDADDTWFPAKLEKESAIIRSYPEVVLFYSKAQRLNSDNPSASDSIISVYGSGKNGEIQNSFKRLISGFTTSASAVTFQKEAFYKCGGFNENFSFSEDTLMFHQLMEHGNVYCLDEMLGVHRIHRTSAVAGASVEKKVISRFRVYEQLITTVRKDNIASVSAAIVNTGIKKIFRTFILFPYNRPDLVSSYLNKALKNPGILLRHKVSLILMLLIEILLSPLKFLWLKYKYS